MERDILVVYLSPSDDGKPEVRWTVCSSVLDFRNKEPKVEKSDLMFVIKGIDITDDFERDFYKGE